MNEMSRTPQEDEWAGQFGDDYVNRNRSESIAPRLAFWVEILKLVNKVGSVVELGCGYGINLQAINLLHPKAHLRGYEINKNAIEIARSLNFAEVIEQSVTETLDVDKKFDLVFTSGVLIHINPNKRDQVYENLVSLSTRYILLYEYYNPTPQILSYRGKKEMIFKADFAGDLLDRFDLDLVNYGFVYSKDKLFPTDDSNWFLLEKRK